MPDEIIKMNKKLENKINDNTFKIIVPARKYSKRLKNKHYREINGKPLYKYTFDYLLECVKKENVWVNTDDNKMISIAKKYGFNTLKRPSKYSNDLSPSIELLRFQKEYFEENEISYNSIALIQLTNPFRPKQLLKNAYSKFLTSGRKSLTSFSILKKKTGTIVSNFYSPFNHKPGVRSQDLENVYFENGLVYIVSSEALSENQIITADTYPYIVNSNHGVIDIDEEEDLIMAETYLKFNLFNNEN